METLVIPNIEDVYARERAKDELPQSGSGRTIMTAEPKFVPEDAVDVTLDGRCIVFGAPGGLRGLYGGRRLGPVRGRSGAHGSHALVRRGGQHEPRRRGGNPPGHRGALHHRHRHDDGRQHLRHPARGLRPRRGARRVGAEGDRQALRARPEQRGARIPTPRRRCGRSWQTNTASPASA